MAATGNVTARSQSRFEGPNSMPTLHLTRHSRYARVRFQHSNFLAGNRVQLHFFLVADPESATPNIQPLPGAMANATVQTGGVVEVMLAFGVQPSQEMQDRSICCITLPQRAAPPKGTHITLTLMCVVRRCPSSSPAPTSSSSVSDDSEFEWLAQYSLLVTSSWSQAVEMHSKALFAANVRAELPDFLSSATVFKLMQARWNSMFGHLRQLDERHDKSRGKFIEEDQEDQRCKQDKSDASTTRHFPELTQQHMEDILRLVLSHAEWDATEFPPLLISKFVFCGASSAATATPAAPTSTGADNTNKFTSLWSVFETLIELVGRSSFIRRLFASGQLFFLTPNDAIEFTAGALARLAGHSPLLHLFRISSSLPVPAMVLEMLRIVDGVAQKVRPSPYVTVEQISEAEGHVYKAFSNLESTHHDVLCSLDPSNRLHPIGESPLQAGPVGGARRVRSDVVGRDDLLNYMLKEPNLVDQTWWSSASQ